MLTVGVRYLDHTPGRPRGRRTFFATATSMESCTCTACCDTPQIEPGEVARPAHLRQRFDERAQASCGFAPSLGLSESYNAEQPARREPVHSRCRHCHPLK